MAPGWPLLAPASPGWPQAGEASRMAPGWPLPGEGIGSGSRGGSRAEPSRSPRVAGEASPGWPLLAPGWPLLGLPWGGWPQDGPCYQAADNGPWGIWHIWPQHWASGQNCLQWHNSQKPPCCDSTLANAVFGVITPLDPCRGTKGHWQFWRSCTAELYHYATLAIGVIPRVFGP